ncbi:MAG: radical SAM protein [Candidatus Omnitrophica bacterium]|nr:radical SAM protein [Candidatus Omnitrophota bacterium]
MVKVFLKILIFRFLKACRWIRPLPLSLTLRVTNTCNLQCKMCNIWKHNAPSELTLQEYTKIFQSIKGKILWVTFDGGEPFLRDDIDEIVVLAYQYIQPHVINILTNGTLPHIIIDKVSTLAQKCPDTHIIVNISIDGIGQQNDEIRGCSGITERVLQTYYGLKNLSYSNLSIGINTTISKFNVSHIADIIKYCLSLKPDSYVLEIAEQRAEFYNIHDDVRPSLTECLESLDILQRELKQKVFKRYGKIVNILRRHYYTFVKKTLQKKKRIIPCLAGTASARLLPNGDIWCCGVREKPMGNIRYEGYDFKKIWLSECSDRIRKEIQTETCYCTAVNPYYTNRACSIPVLMR